MKAILLNEEKHVLRLAYIPVKPLEKRLDLITSVLNGKIAKAPDVCDNVHNYFIISTIQYLSHYLMH